jgi:LysM repeat protein
MYASGGGWDDATLPGEKRRVARPRSAIHDPWREPRRVAAPSTLPTGPTLFVAGAAVLLAFLLGLAMGGGDGGQDKVAASTDTTSKSITTTTGAPSFHTVQENESLSSIAAQYGITIDELAVANNIGDVNSVQEGQRLVIPAPVAPTASTVVPTTAKKNK